jgi:hypothetical protein
MGRIPLIGLVGALAFLFSACSSSLYSYREQAWRRDAEAICMAKGGYTPSAYIERVRRIDDKGVCGIWQPLKVSRALSGYVGLDQSLLLTCPMTGALDGWLFHVVEPAAAATYGAYVTDIQTFGSYNCRTRNSVSAAKASEHAFGNAVDVAGFTLSDGRTITVEKGWRGDPVDSAFLHQVHKGACGIFTTVLGPDGDRAHYNHFHLDMARHNADGTYHYCR